MTTTTINLGEVGRLLDHEDVIDHLEIEIDDILSIIDELPTLAKRQRAAEFLQERWTRVRGELSERGEVLLKELSEAWTDHLGEIMSHLLKVDRLLSIMNEEWPLSDEEEKPSAPVIKLVPDKDGDEP